MRKELVSLSKETLIYGTSTVVSRSLNFLLVPFYVNVLASTAEYGVASSLYAWIAFLNVIYPLGLEGAYFRYAAKGKHEEHSPEQERAYFSSPFTVLLIVGLLLSSLLFVLAPYLAEPLFSDRKMDITSMMPILISIVQFSAVILLCDSLASLPFAVLRLEHKAKRFAAIKLVNIIITLAFNFYFILGLKMGVQGIFLANLIASASTVLLLLPSFLPRLKLSLDREVLRKMIPFGLTNVPAHMGAMMVQVIDRPIVQAYLGLGAVGIYQANYRMGFIMMIFVSLFEYAWRPFFMRQHKTDDAKARLLFSRVFTYFMLACLLGFLFLAFFLPYILSTPIFGRQLLRADYLVGMSIIPVVLFAYIFQGMYTNFIAGIYIANRNRVLPLITGAGAGVNVLVNIILIPVVGIMGAAYATLLAYMVMAYLLYKESQKVYPIKYEWGRVIELFVTV
ncbi:MAG TPA: oligosaccharide flippase family protein, partial [Candidatus Kapabacteria bacterium]